MKISSKIIGLSFRDDSVFDRRTTCDHCGRRRMCRWVSVWYQVFVEAGVGGGNVVNDCGIGELCAQCRNEIGSEVE